MPIPSRGRRLSARRVALLAHRYVGLATMVFLIVTGLTGSVLAFYQELDMACSPELYRAKRPTEPSAPLDPFSLRERVLEHIPAGATVAMVPLDTPPGRAVAFWVDLPEALKEAGSDTEYFVDPYSGELNGTRRWGDPPEGSPHFSRTIA